MNQGTGRPGSGPDTAILAVGAAVFGVAGVVWAGAFVAAGVTGERLGVGLPDAITALRHLPGNASDPAAAWVNVPVGILPHPVIYWAATITVAVITAGAAITARRWWQASTRRGRVRLGVDTAARFAAPADVAPLVVDDASSVGRFVLGEAFGKLLATEDRANSPASGRGRRRQGDRGSVAIIGPSRCGKTTNVMASLCDWPGPAIVVSVKRDLWAATHTRRATRGTVHVFDPAHVTGLPTGELARWAPIRAATSTAGAQRAAATIAAAIPSGGVEDGDYWTEQCQLLLAGLLTAAALDPTRTMIDVVRWVFNRDGTIAHTSEVIAILDRVTRDGTNDEQRLASKARLQLNAVWGMEERTMSSVYATVFPGVRVWLDDDVETSALPHPDYRYLNLDHITNAANTLYLVAPLNDQKRFRPVLGGFLGDLKDQIYLADTHDNGLPQPLLMIIDEAGNMPLSWLPEVVATCAGIGVLLVTIWQSKAQLDAAYEKLADSVLTNHLSKIVFTGCSDEATLDYLSRLIGREEITRRSTTHTDAGSKSTTESTTNEALTPWHVLRQSEPGNAILIHGTLPPTPIRGRHPEPR